MGSNGHTLVGKLIPKENVMSNVRFRRNIKSRLRSPVRWYQSRRDKEIKSAKERSLQLRNSGRLLGCNHSDSVQKTVTIASKSPSIIGAQQTVCRSESDHCLKVKFANDVLRDAKTKSRKGQGAYTWRR